MSKNKSIDSIIVIGGGSTGCSVAYNMASRGKKVRLIERENIASGNTGKSSALVRTHYSNKLIASLAKYSLEQFMNFENIGYSGFTKTGMVFPFNANNSDTAREIYKMLKSLDIDEQKMPIKQLKTIFPDINSEDLDYILYEPNSGYADPVATAGSYASAAANLGAEIITGTSVEKIGTDNSRTYVETGKGFQYYADAIVMATNVWSNQLLMKSGITDNNFLPIYASVHDIIYIRRPEKYAGMKPTLWDPQKLAYYKMEGSSITAIGSLSPEIDNTEFDMKGDIENHVTDEYIEMELNNLTERLPGMEDATLISTATGLYDMSPDGQAIIDSLADIGLENVYVCAGLSGHGFKLSPAYGKIVADMLTLQDPAKALFDWRNFSLDRFKNGKSIKSMYSGIGTIY
ncbi:FAD-binding oxidoreductase [Ferroplasma sp.]|uniref:NAD(P)/FAD-dependent oxidoreductase n=1 Tax=Ferroplasma sp. TaxID=2591003 RepID=UPI00307D3860